MNRTLSQRNLMRGLFLSGIVVLAAGGLLLLFRMWNATDVTAPLRHTEELVSYLRDDLARTSTNALRKTQHLAKTPELTTALKNGDREALEKLMNRFILDSLELDIISIFDSKGIIQGYNTHNHEGEPYDRARLATLFKRDFSQRKIITDCLKNKASSSQVEFQMRCDFTPVYFESTGLSIAFSEPVFDPATGERAGVLSTRLNSRRLLDIVHERNERDPSRKLLLVSESGLLFDEYGAKAGKSPVPESVLKEVVQEARSHKGEIYSTIKGSNYFAASLVSLPDVMPGGNLYAVGLMENPELEKRRRILIQGGFVIVIIVLLAVITAVFYRNYSANSKTPEAYEDKSLQMRRSRMLHILSGAVLLCLLGATYYGWTYAQNALRELSERQFAEETSGYKALIHQRLELYANALHGVEALFAASKSVERDEWSAYLKKEDTMRRYPGIFAIRYVEFLLSEQLPEFLAATRLEVPDFRIHPESGLTDHYVVKYEKSTEGNESALGRDLGADPKRRWHMEKARDEGKPVLSGLLEGVENKSHKTCFVIFVPIYKNDMPTRNRGEKRLASQGFVNGVFRAEDLMAGIFGDKLAAENIKLKVFDGIAPLTKNLFYDSGGSAERAEGRELFWEGQVAFGGRIWTLHFSGPSHYGLSSSEKNSPVWVTSAGVIVSFLIFAVLWSLATSRERAVGLAETMTVDLQHEMKERQRLESLRDTQYRIARILAESGSLEDAVSRILQTVADSLDWDCGMAWVPDKESGVLRSLENWGARPEAKLFMSKSAEMTFLPGAGLPGRVWLSRTSLWIPDILHDETFARIRLAREAGVKSAFAFPILIENVFENEVLGVIEFFSHEIREPDQDILAMFASIGSQIGQFMERKRGEEEIRRARDFALDASRAKSDFLATMSHEIRTPLNAIIGMSELLAETPLSNEQKEFVQTLRRGGDTLLKLISDILDLSKIEAGHLELEEIDFHFTEFMERTMEIMAVRAHQKNLELTCSMEPSLPAFFRGDPNRLRQILLNLIGNAVKFTENGEVMVEVRPVVAEDGIEKVLFVIKDTGIGIPKDKLAAIFEPFTQADSSTTRRYGGTGLGLSICKKLVEKMQGILEVQSRLGEGTTFSFLIPLQAASPEVPVTASPPAPGRPLEGCRALVVDDNATNRLILTQALESWGAVVKEAVGGRECFMELHHARTEGFKYQVLLLDGRMPGMGGFDVARALKNDPTLAPTVVMMLTSDARSGDLALAKELDLSRYLVKPVKKTELYAALLSVLSEKKESGAKVPVSIVQDSPGGASRPLKILLVEDSPDNRLLIKAYLKKMPYEVMIAENGAEAVEMARLKNFDLILMDMHMPVMDGYAATRAIRNKERENGESAVPILALTANALKEDVQRSLDVGCNAHLTKPIRKNSLLESIAAYARKPGEQAA